jgi:hypothetical protein
LLRTIGQGWELRTRFLIFESCWSRIHIYPTLTHQFQKERNCPTLVKSRLWIVFCQIWFVFNIWVFLSNTFLDSFLALEPKLELWRMWLFI